MSTIMSPNDLKSLKKFLRAKGIRQVDIASSLGITQGQLSRILNGKVSKQSQATLKLTEKYAHKIKSGKPKCICADEISKAALTLWDGEPSSAEQVIAFLRSAKDFRSA